MIWRKTIDFTIEAFEKLKSEDFTRATMQYGGATNSYPCSILRRCYKMETIKYCNKLNELGNPLFVGLRYFTVDDEFLKLVHEGPYMSLKDYVKKHRDDFFIMEGKFKELFYVSPLLQKLTRELLVATKEINDHGIELFPVLSSVYLYIGSGGTISIKVSPLQCRPKPLISDLSNRLSAEFEDSMVGCCVQVIESLFQMVNASPINELIDLKQRARSKKWWEDLNELFAHPFFWSSGEHESVLMSVHMHMQRPQASKPPNILMGGLDLLADELKNEWDKQHKCWNGPWTAAFDSEFVIPRVWENKLDDSETIIRLTRNLMAHHNNHDFYLYGTQWYYRKDLYIHFMNRTHNLSVALFNTVQTVQKKFEMGVYQGTGYNELESCFQFNVT
ncbi:unnamed protein product [Camellia sinensis]